MANTPGVMESVSEMSFGDALERRAAQVQETRTFGRTFQEVENYGAVPRSAKG